MVKFRKALLSLFLFLFSAFAFLTVTVGAEEMDPPADYEAWTSTSSLPQSGTAGKYYLTENVQLTEEVILSHGTDLTIDLMGHTITQKTAGVRIFRLSNGASLTIEDSTAIGFGSNYAAGGLFGSAAQTEPGQIVGIYNYQNETGAGQPCSFTMKGGIMDGYASTSYLDGKWGGAITVNAAGAKVRIDGGQFRNFSCGYGAVIGATVFEEITINGGEFLNNRSFHSSDSVEGEGGGVIAVNVSEGASTKITVNGGYFHNNSAKSAGVILISGPRTELVINGGEFYNNSATEHGGVIRTVQNGTKTTISGGSFHNNHAGSYGGVIFAGSALYVTGGYFYENDSDGNAGVFYLNQAYCLLSDCTIISNSTATGHSGCFYQTPGADLILRGVVNISDNYAKNVGIANMELDTIADVSGLKAGSHIGFRLDGRTQFAKSASRDIVPVFVPDNSELMVEYQSGFLNVVEKDPENTSYHFTSGAGGFFTLKSGKALYFSCDGPAAELVGLSVDGNPLSEDSFTLDRTTGDAKLSYQYLNTLSAGTHSVNYLFSRGSCTPVQFQVLLSSEYSITRGAGASYTKKTDTALRFVSNGPSTLFQGIRVDGKRVGPNDFTAESGVTAASLKPAFLNTLSDGTHTVEFIFAQGSCIPTEITILPTLDYEIVSGADSVYRLNSGQPLVFLSDGLQANFRELQLDGTPLSTEDYTAEPAEEEGLTAFTLKESLLSTLSEGTHTLTFTYNPGKCAPVSFTAKLFLDYSIVSGTGSSFKRQTSGSLSFVSDGPISSFKGVQVDGMTVSADQYTVKEEQLSAYGCTVVEFSSTYLNTLAVGNHVVTIMHDPGTSPSTAFSIASEDSDALPIGVYVGFGVVAVLIIGMIAFVLIFKKGEQ